jgi:hypothetical protein
MQIDNFEKFWLYYLHEHGRRETRELHVLGTCAALGLIAFAATLLQVAPRYRPTSPAKLLGLAALAGYGPAWIAHFFYEKNRPATFDHPICLSFRIFE